MSFTPLQELVLNHASGLASSMQEQIHALSRKYNFQGPLCEFDTPENDLMKTARQLEEILDALLKERK